MLRGRRADAGPTPLGRTVLDAAAPPAEDGRPDDERWAALRRELATLDPSLPLFGVQPLAEHVAAASGRVRQVLLVATPLIGLLNVLQVDAGDAGTMVLAGYRLEVLRADKLSLLFGYLFHIAAILAAPLYVLYLILSFGGSLPQSGIPTERYRAIEASSAEVFASVAFRAIALLLVAEMLRNTGRFTMADVLSFRMRQRPVRTAAAISTLAVSFFYLLAQMAGAGGLVALLLNVQGKTGQGLVIAGVGALMIIYVMVGGMKGTTWVQIIKAVLLIGGAIIIALLVAIQFKLNFSSLLGDAAADPNVVARRTETVRRALEGAFRPPHAAHVATSTAGGRGGGGCCGRRPRGR